jgi:predicted acylesterase/phospholipase RssA
VIWNIGAIASSNDPGALSLIQDILVASAAIPAAFPPMMIDVEADGTSYQEMHVDGSTRSQVFLYPPTLNLKDFAEDAGIVRDRVAFIIRNGRLDPNWAMTERLTLPIAARAISSLIQASGVGDLYRLYLETRRDEIDFNLAFIPPSFSVIPTEVFDQVYMTALFDNGYSAASQPGGYPWSKTPPGYNE